MSKTQLKKRKTPVATAAAAADSDGDVVMDANHAGGGCGGGDAASWTADKKQKPGPDDTKIAQIVEDFKGDIHNAAVEAFGHYLRGPHIDGVQKFKFELKVVPVLRYASQPDIERCMDELKLFGSANGSCEVSKIIGQYAAMPINLELIQLNRTLMAQDRVHRNLVEASELCYFGEGSLRDPWRVNKRAEKRPYAEFEQKERLNALAAYNFRLSCPYVFAVETTAWELLGHPGALFRISDVSHSTLFEVIVEVDTFETFMEANGEREYEKPTFFVRVIKARTEYEDSVFGFSSPESVSAYLVTRRFWGSDALSPGIAFFIKSDLIETGGTRFYIPIPQGIAEDLLQSADPFRS